MATKTSEILKQPYSRIVIPQEDGTFYAEIVEFSSCFAQGESRSEALEMLEKVAASWLRIAIERNQPIPPPMNVGASGRFVLRLPKEIHRKAILHAKRNGISLNQFVSAAVSAAVGANDYNSILAEHFMRVFLPISGADAERHVESVSTFGGLKSITLGDMKQIAFLPAGE